MSVYTKFLLMPAAMLLLVSHIAISNAEQASDLTQKVSNEQVNAITKMQATPQEPSSKITSPTTPSIKENPLPQDQNTKDPKSITTYGKSEQLKKDYFNDTKVVIGTGAVTGVYYPAGGGICRLINKARQTLGMRCGIETTPGSIYNISALKSDEIQLAIIQSDWEENAYNGTGPFSGGKNIANLRFLFSLHAEAMTILVTQQSDIQKFSDIKGRKVNIGAEGSGVRATVDEIFKAKNWSKADFKALLELKPAEQLKALCDGTIDVMILATGHPNGTLQDLVKTCEVRAIDLDDPDIDKLVQSNPEYSFTVIPGGLYPGLPKDIKTFGVKAVVVATTNLGDDIVYNITKLMFENLDAFKSLHPVFNQLDPQKMISEGKTVPYHPGALRYYNEKGWQVINP